MVYLQSALNISTIPEVFWIDIGLTLWLANGRRCDAHQRFDLEALILIKLTSTTTGSCPVQPQSSTGSSGSCQYNHSLLLVNTGSFPVQQQPSTGGHWELPSTTTVFCQWTWDLPSASIISSWWTMGGKLATPTVRPSQFWLAKPLTVTHLNSCVAHSPRASS